MRWSSPHGRQPTRGMARTPSHQTHTPPPSVARMRAHRRVTMDDDADLFVGTVRTRLSPAAIEYKNSFCDKSFPARSDGHKSVNMPGHVENTTHCFFVQCIATWPSMVASFSLGRHHGASRMAGPGTPSPPTPSTVIPPLGQCPGPCQALPSASRAHVYGAAPFQQVTGAGLRQRGIRGSCGCKPGFPHGRIPPWRSFPPAVPKDTLEVQPVDPQLKIAEARLGMVHVQTPSRFGRPTRYSARHHRGDPATRSRRLPAWSGRRRLFYRNICYG
jgi:hypothetical protein